MRSDPWRAERAEQTGGRRKADWSANTDRHQRGRGDDPARDLPEGAKPIRRTTPVPVCIAVTGTLADTTVSMKPRRDHLHQKRPCSIS